MSVYSSIFNLTLTRVNSRVKKQFIQFKYHQIINYSTYQIVFWFMKEDMVRFIQKTNLILKYQIGFNFKDSTTTKLFKRILRNQYQQSNLNLDDFRMSSVSFQQPPFIPTIPPPLPPTILTIPIEKQVNFKEEVTNNN